MTKWESTCTPPHLPTAEEITKYFCLHGHKPSLDQQQHKSRLDSTQEPGWMACSLQPGQGCPSPLLEARGVAGHSRTASEPHAAVSIGS